MLPLIWGRVEADMPGWVWPNCHLTWVMNSPAPRPGGGAVRVVFVAASGDAPHSVNTPGAVFFE